MNQLYRATTTGKVLYMRKESIIYEGIQITSTPKRKIEYKDKDLHGEARKVTNKSMRLHLLNREKRLECGQHQRLHLRVQMYENVNT